VIFEADIGNSFCKWRLLDLAGQVQGSGRLTTHEIARLSRCEQLAAAKVTTARVGCVAGITTEQKIADEVRNLWQLEAVFARTSKNWAGLTNSYSDPSKMGVDRWLACLASARRAPGEALCVIDCGSAITVEWLDKYGQHLGGYIVPGLRLMQQSLLQNTAQVRWQSAEDEWLTAPGTDTAGCVSNGCRFVYEGLAQQLAAQSGYRFFVTGGDGELMAQLIAGARWVPDLVLEGLVLAELVELER